MPRAAMPIRAPRSPQSLLATSPAAERASPITAPEPSRPAAAGVTVDTRLHYPSAPGGKRDWHAAGVTAARSHHAPRPRETLDRRALRAQLRGDPMLGTAFPAARILLVEQPGPWGERGLRDSQFGEEEAAALEARAGRAGVRVQAIRRPGRTPADAVRRWAFADTRDGHESLHWGKFT